MAGKEPELTDIHVPDMNRRETIFRRRKPRSMFGPPKVTKLDGGTVKMLGARGGNGSLTEATGFGRLQTAFYLNIYSPEERDDVRIGVRITRQRAEAQKPFLSWSNVYHGQPRRCTDVGSEVFGKIQDENVEAAEREREAC